MKNIPLTKGMYTMVDDCDFELISQYKWRVQSSRNGKFYAITGDRKNAKMMHRLILNVVGDIKVDHKDGDGLNNTRSNLRLCSQRENCFNRKPSKKGTSQFLGVSWNTQWQKWHVQIQKDRKNMHCGSYDDEREAARAYDAKAKELFGPFAHLNFPSETSELDA